MSTLMDWAVWSILVYFILSHGSYLLLNALSLLGMRRIEQRKMLVDLPHLYSGLETPVSLLFVTRDEAAEVVASVSALLQLNYPTFEVIVINDGSQDATLEILTATFGLLPFPEAYRVQLATQTVTRIYRSTRYPNLRVLDKDVGGRADAMNAGLNAARYPLVCSTSSKTILQKDSLNVLVAPFLNDNHVVATTGAMRIANDCDISDGYLTGTRLTHRLLPLFQTVEYLRTFLFAPLGWATLNALLAAPMGIHLLRKDAVIAVGGYDTDAINEEMDLMMRMHRLMRARRQPYQIRFVAAPVCWHHVPTTVPALRAQRTHWQQDLSDSLRRNRGLLFSRNGGLPGFVTFPFFLLFEWLGPLLETLGYAFIALAYAGGYIPWQTCVAFLSLAIGMGILLSVTGLLLEEISFHLYPEPADIARLLAIAIIGNFGYRQLNAYWRARALIGQLRLLRRDAHAAEGQ